MSIYQKHELARQNVFQRLFKIQPKENFILELENMLREHEADIANVQDN